MRTGAAQPLVVNAYPLTTRPIRGPPADFGNLMIKRVRGNASAAILLAVMCLVEAFALQAQTLGIVLIGIACVLALIVLAARADMKRVALGAAYLCAFTLTWNGWFVGPVRPGDVLVLITLLCFAV